MELLSEKRDELFNVRVGSKSIDVKIRKRGLESMVPHRGIALCLDQICYSSSKKNHLFANWTPGKRYFVGHFPEKMILPGHWHGESVSLAAACLSKLAFPEINGIPVLKKQRLDINLKRPLLYGDTINISTAIARKEKRYTKFSFRTFDDSDKTLSEGTIIGMPMAS